MLYVREDCRAMRVQDMRSRLRSNGARKSSEISQGKTESVARSVSLKSLKRKGINVQGNVRASAEVTVILAPTSFAESAIGQGRAEFGERVPA